jgi:tetratricopeptide (TPR) repeat protein
MGITSQVLIDGIEGKLSDVELTNLVEQLCALTSSEVLLAARQAGINIRGDGNIVGNNNVNIVIKGDLARILQDAFTHSHALHQLQTPVADFVGRESETEQIIMSLRHDGAAIISGMGGIGKSELVLHTADQLRDDYPDGQLLVNMRGTDETPREPKEALAECVRAFVGFESKLPDNLDELASLYRSVLSNKRVLLFFDDAANGSQLSPMRPPSGCGTLVTSRTPIALPGITNIRLGELSPMEARDLLRRIAGEIDAVVADSICELCGYLPLAVRAAGSLLSVTADLDPADFLNQLRDERTRLEKLGTEGTNISVRASFNLSYARLSPEAAAVFRRLAVFRSSFDSTASESICEDEGHKHLTDLVRRSLVLYDKVSRRYRLHELIRVFAQSLLSEDQRAVSEKEFARYYLRVLEKSNQLYLQSGPEYAQGLHMFRTERENIRHGWALSSHKAEIDAEIAEICWTYTRVGYNILLNRLPTDELKVWCQRSLSIAKHLNNRAAEFDPGMLLGLVHESIGEYGLADEHFRQALALAYERKDQQCAAIAYHHLGRAVAHRGFLYEAIENFEHAQRLFCGIGQHENELKVLQDIALAHSRLKDTHQAIGQLQIVLDIARKNGYKLEEANALANLALVHGNSKNKHEALGYLEQALELFKELGYRHWEVQTIYQTGNLYVELGETDKGIERIEQALSIYREAGDLHGEVCAIGALAGAYMSLEPQEAIKRLDEQLNVARKARDRHREGDALGNRGIVLLNLGDVDSAIETLKEAVKVAQATGNHNHEFHSLCHLGKAYARLGKREEAVKTFEDHVRVAETMGVFRNKAHALSHLVALYKEWGDIERAIEYARIGIRDSQLSNEKHDYPASIFALAELYAEMGNYSQAVSQAEIARPLFEQLGDMSCAVKAKDYISLWNNKRGEQEATHGSVVTASS